MRALLSEPVCECFCDRKVIFLQLRTAVNEATDKDAVPLDVKAKTLNKGL
jgi:hypothetical protein